MRLLSPPTLALALFLGAGPVVAQAQQTMTFEDPGSVTDYGYYIGTYGMTWQSAPGGPQMIDIWCLDFNHRVSLGQTYSAYFTPLSSGDMSLTRFGGAMKTQYAMAAWLTMQFSATPTVNWGGIQAAMWYVMDPTAAVGAQAAADAQSWITLAETGIQQPGFSLSQFTIISDVNSSTGSVQEFITRDVSVTPEPAMVVMLATGLLCLFVVYRRRRQVA